MKLLVPFLFLASVECCNNEGNLVTVTFTGDVFMDKNALVIIDGGIAGHVEEINYEGHLTRMKLSLLDPGPISRNSTVEAGFAPIYGGRCVLIRPGSDLEFLANVETLKGMEKDTLQINFPGESEADNVLKKRALEILKEQNRKDSLEQRER
jgi:hypothetical protein